ncbi:MAG: YicC family protein [Bacteroidetes bacterium]|nr:YicC family protein [Bacteroidota bacterium]
MLRSMTGYGRSERAVGERTFLVEIRSLNGKQFEALVKLPQLIKPFEFEVRQTLSEKLQRGSIECNVTLKLNGAAKPVQINTDLATSYHRQLSQLCEALGMDRSGILDALLRLPEVVATNTDALDATDWTRFKEILEEAVCQVDLHRINEGASLERDLRERIACIRRLQQDLMRVEPQRRERVRTQMRKALEENLGAERYDANRMEQELLHYIEKMDISEEQVRLLNHCEYFESVMAEASESKGKKLSFVLQEIGREINTTGSKAYDADIQRIVVSMKDELEKAKEQVLNVL